jgi:hypothetical protein
MGYKLFIIAKHKANYIRLEAMLNSNQLNTYSRTLNTSYIEYRKSQLVYRKSYLVPLKIDYYISQSPATPNPYPRQ